MSQERTNLLYVVKSLEEKGDWREAENIWRTLGNEREAEACKLIADSIERGDKYRQQVKEQLGPEPNAMENPYAYLQWHKRLQEIYNEHFKR